MNPSIPVKTDDGRVIGEVLEAREVDALIAEGRLAVRDARVATRDQRTPPWKTPAGRAAKARQRRNKRARAARKANR